MRAGKRLDCFRASYTGDPLAAFRLNVKHPPSEPNWNMFLDSGPTMAYVEPPKTPEDEEEPDTHEPDDEDDEDEGEIRSAYSKKPTTRRK